MNESKEHFAKYIIELLDVEPIIRSYVEDAIKDLKRTVKHESLTTSGIIYAKSFYDHMYTTISEKLVSAPLVSMATNNADYSNMIDWQLNFISNAYELFIGGNKNGTK